MLTSDCCPPQIGVLYSENEAVLSTVAKMCHLSEASSDTLDTFDRLLSDRRFVDQYLRQHQASTSCTPAWLSAQDFVRCVDVSIHILVARTDAFDASARSHSWTTREGLARTAPIDSPAVTTIWAALGLAGQPEVSHPLLTPLE